MLPSFRALGGTRRSTRSVSRLLFTMTLLVVLSGCSSQLVSSDSPSNETSSDAADPGHRKLGPNVRIGRLALGNPKTADLDFPKLPLRCFAPKQPTPRAAPCYVTSMDPNRPTVVLWGDSHAWQYLPALRGAVRGRPVNLVSFVAGGCPPAVAPETAEYDTKCDENDRAALEYIRQLSDQGASFKLILGSFWGGFRLGYQRMILDDITGRTTYSPFTAHAIQLAHVGTEPLFAELTRLKTRVDVIGQSPTVPNEAAPCARGMEPYRCDLPRSEAIPEEAVTQRWLASMMQPLAGRSRLIDPLPLYCDKTVCHGSIRGLDTFYDHLHLAAKFTATMSSYFVPSIKDLL